MDILKAVAKSIVYEFFRSLPHLLMCSLMLMVGWIYYEKMLEIGGLHVLATILFILVVAAVALVVILLDYKSDLYCSRAVYSLGFDHKGDIIIRKNSGLFFAFFVCLLSPIILPIKIIIRIIQCIFSSNYRDVVDTLFEDVLGFLMLSGIIFAASAIFAGIFFGISSLQRKKYSPSSENIQIKNCQIVQGYYGSGLNLEFDYTFKDIDGIRDKDGIKIVIENEQGYTYEYRYYSNNILTPSYDLHESFLINDSLQHSPVWKTNCKVYFVFDIVAYKGSIYTEEVEYDNDSIKIDCGILKWNC
ncbi:MAG: hypothetical protein E7363_00430 [Clostridiales bacterium]|nr:hypothetical protein [Clostridiales bacterium]